MEPNENLDVQPGTAPLDPALELKVADSTLTEPVVEPNSKTSVEEVRIDGDGLVAKVKELIHEGNIRRIIIKNQEGDTLIEIPFTVGVVGGAIGTLAFPIVAALGAIGAMVAHLTLVVEKKVD
ncbi:MAG: DUF4342 domain-containing protein [Cyanobacteriota bacterium]|nr:DUF4342 domain-containing protein [Cyanobacteriota bacterium]